MIRIASEGQLLWLYCCLLSAVSLLIKEIKEHNTGKSKGVANKKVSLQAMA